MNRAARLASAMEAEERALTRWLQLLREFGPVSLSFEQLKLVRIGGLRKLGQCAQAALPRHPFPAVSRGSLTYDTKGWAKVNCHGWAKTSCQTHMYTFGRPRNRYRH